MTMEPANLLSGESECASMGGGKVCLVGRKGSQLETEILS